MWPWLGCEDAGGFPDQYHPFLQQVLLWSSEHFVD
jgi:hypothetical protein